MPMKELKKGDVLTLPAKHVTQDMIFRYADAAEDHNPLHVDPEFAKTTRYGGTIAHGMLTAAFIQELLVRTFGMDWIESGTIEVSFITPVHPGEIIATEAKVVHAVPAEGAENKVNVRLRLSCMNSKQEQVIKGQASVTVSLD